MNKIIARVRITKNSQKILTIPKCKHTDSWEIGDLVELIKIDLDGDRKRT